MNRKFRSEALAALAALSTLPGVSYAQTENAPVYSPDVPFMIQQVKPTVINGVLVVGHQEPVWVNPDSVPVHQASAAPVQERAEDKLNALADSVTSKTMRSEQEKALSELQASTATNAAPAAAVPPVPPPATLSAQPSQHVATASTPIQPKAQPVAAAAPANTPAPAPTSFTFEAEGGEMLSRMLKRNLQKFGWDLAWRASADYNVFKAFKIEGTSIPDAVAQVGKVYGITPVIYTTNRVVLISDPEQRMPNSFAASNNP